MQSIEEEIPQVDCLTHNLLDKKQAAYINVRSIRYGPRCSFLQKRRRSQGKVQRQFNAKNRLLVDEQLTHSKTMLDYNRSLTQKIINQNYNIKYEDIKLDELACQAQLKYKQVLDDCKLKNLRLDKRQRNYSEPKYKQATKNQAPRKATWFQNAQCPYYFMNSYKALQEIIIEIKRKKTENFINACNHNEDAQVVSYCDNLWAWISGGLGFIAKFNEIDIFSRQHIISSLKEYHHVQIKKEQSLLVELFQDPAIARDLHMNQKEIRMRRMSRLKELAQAMKIKEDSENALDFDRIFYNFRRIKPRQYRQSEHQHIRILARVMKIRPFVTASAEKRFLVEYYIGLHRVVIYEELEVTHPKQLQKYLQSL